jgi:hypothetical protein
MHGTLEQEEEEGARTGSYVAPHARPHAFVPLTADEFWKDDVELLRSVIIQEGRRYGTTAPRKSVIGVTLRQTNPARFPHRPSIKAFFAQAIEKGVVEESGTGAFKTLTLADGASRSRSWLTVGIKAPLAPGEIPPKALEMASKGLPFILFVRRLYCPSGYPPPSQAFIQSTDEWLLFMYATHADVLQSAASYPWLRKGTLVDWRSVSGKQCSVCKSHFSSTEDKIFFAGEEPICSQTCKAWLSVTDDYKERVAKLTSETLEFMAENDDVFTSEYILRKLLVLRNPELCSDPKIAKLWIKEALSAEMVISFKHPGSKNKSVCLRRFYNQSPDGHVSDDLDTSLEETFISDLLWDQTNAGGLDRREVSRKLAAAFAHMSTPSMRNNVLSNAQAKGDIFLVRGSFLHVVGLTKEQAEAVLDLEMTKLFGRESNEVLGDTMCTNPEIPVEIDGGADAKVGVTAKIQDSSDESCDSSSVGLEKEQNTNCSTDEAQSISAPLFNALIDENGNLASNNLHVSGFGKSTTKQEIYRKFKQFVDIVDVVPKGYGNEGCSFMFVNTTSRDGAIEARKQLYAEELNGGCLKINFAK